MNKLNRFLSSRPLPVTIAAIFVLCMTTWEGLRAVVAAADRELLSTYDANPAYIITTGLVWFLAGLALLAAFMTGKRYSPLAGLILSMLYIIWYWVDRLAIQVSPARNLAFSAVVSTLLLLVFNAALFWPSSRAFFTKETR